MPRFDRTRPSGGTTSLRSVKQVLGCKVGPSGASDFRLATPLPERIVTELALPDQGGGSESLGLRSPWVGLAKLDLLFPKAIPLALSGTSSQPAMGLAVQQSLRSS